MRLVAWNCNMALHRKIDALRRLAPDIAVISECASPERLHALGALDGVSGDPIWIGDNPYKGLAVFAFNGYRARLARGFNPRLRYILPVFPYVYIATGNGYADPPQRTTDAVIALDLKTGKTKWVNQVLPGDVWMLGCRPENPVLS